MAEEEAPVRFSPTVLVQSIENFASGDIRKLTNFLQAIEHAADIGGWTDLQKFQVAIMKLKSEALECYNTSVGVVDWEQLKTLLVARFGTSEPRAVLRRKLNSCEQRIDEDPVQFGQRLKALQFLIMPELQEADEEVRGVVAENLMDRFMDGLRPSLRRTVLSKQPADWQTALEIAQYEYQLEEMDAKTKAARLHALFNDHSHNGLNKPMQQSEEGKYQGYDQRKVICHRCHKPGHIAKFCYSKIEPPNGNNQGNYQPKKFNNNYQGDTSNMPFPQVICPLCGGRKFHAVACPAATPVNQVTAYNPPAQRDPPNGMQLPLNRRNGEPSN